MTNAEAWFNIALRPRKPEGSLGRTAQDGHLDSHTAPEPPPTYLLTLLFCQCHFDHKYDVSPDTATALTPQTDVTSMKVT